MQILFGVGENVHHQPTCLEWPLAETERERGQEASLPPSLAVPPSNHPPPVTQTPSVSVGLYPQPPAACLEQQQRETVGERKEEEERHWILSRVFILMIRSSLWTSLGGGATWLLWMKVSLEPFRSFSIPVSRKRASMQVRSMNICAEGDLSHTSVINVLLTRVNRFTGLK